MNRISHSRPRGNGRSRGGEIGRIRCRGRDPEYSPRVSEVEHRDLLITKGQRVGPEPFFVSSDAG